MFATDGVDFAFSLAILIDGQSYKNKIRTNLHWSQETMTHQLTKLSTRGCRKAMHD
ncbi:MAG: hypothetical protein ACON4U_04990 [Myxococcota bacterium]